MVCVQAIKGSVAVYRWSARSVYQWQQLCSCEREITAQPANKSCPLNFTLSVWGEKRGAFIESSMPGYFHHPALINQLYSTVLVFWLYLVNPLAAFSSPLYSVVWFDPSNQNWFVCCSNSIPVNINCTTQPTCLGKGVLMVISTPPERKGNNTEKIWGTVRSARLSHKKRSNQHHNGKSSAQNKHIVIIIKSKSLLNWIVIKVKKKVHVKLDEKTVLE